MSGRLSSAVITARVDGIRMPGVRTNPCEPADLPRRSQPGRRSGMARQEKRRLTPELVRPGSGERAWGLCRANPLHEWEPEIRTGVSGSGCPKWAAIDSD